MRADAAPTGAFPRPGTTRAIRVLASSRRAIAMGQNRSAMDTDALARGFEELYAYIASEPRLLSFVAAADRLRVQAASLARGDLRIERIERELNAVIPTRQLATGIVDIMDRFPMLEESETLEFIKAYAQLLGNLVNGITCVIFRSYPDLMRRDTTSN